MSGSHVFFDISVAGEDAQRVIFKLFDDDAPKASKNFRELCLGHKTDAGSVLTYEGCAFHRVIPGFMIQGGDITQGDGTGGVSIFGGKFPDEASALALKHDRPFLLSMANAGKDTNGSQFFVTTVPCSHLNGKHMVFGEVVSGKRVISAVEGVETGARDAPLPTQRCVIKACGECAAPQPEAPLPVARGRSRSRSYSRSSSRSRSRSRSYSRSPSRSRSRSYSSYSRSSRSRTPSPKRPAASAGGPPLPSDTDPELAAIALMEKRKHKWLSRGRAPRGDRRDEGQRRGRSRSRSPVRSGRGAPRASGGRPGVKGRGSVRYRDASGPKGRSDRRGRYEATASRRDGHSHADQRRGNGMPSRRPSRDEQRSDWGGEALPSGKPGDRVRHLSSGMRVERRPAAAAAAAAAPSNGSRWGGSGYGKATDNYDDI